MQASTISRVATRFSFEHEAAFVPERARDVLHGVPELPGVFALFGHNEGDQPYVTRGANLRRRMARLLDSPETAVGPEGQPIASKRLNLRNRVARMAWSVTGSEFESLLLSYNAHSALFGAAEARRRLKLRTPFFVRFTTEAAHPRVYVTNRLSKRALGELYGPFPSRTAAERYADGVLDLFKLRRCHEQLVVSPEHPGCVYGEMKRCMAPCNTSCTAEEYSAEALAVRAFLETHGESLLAGVARERDEASGAMDFERAAALHRQWEKVKAAAREADALVAPISRLRGVVVQAAATDAMDVDARDPEQATLFLLERGRLAGPARLSTRGVRAVREQTSVGSSLFAQPLMLQAVPLAGESQSGAVVTDPRDGPVPVSAATGALSPEDRAAEVLVRLREKVGPGEADMVLLSDHLALLRRWYYRPEKQRAGELFLPNADGSWPLRRILRGASRAALGDPKLMQETDREGARVLKTKVLHAGREGVERAVPVLSSVSIESASIEGALPGEEPAGFRSRRRREQPR